MAFNAAHDVAFSRAEDEVVLASPRALALAMSAPAFRVDYRPEPLVEAEGRNYYPSVEHVTDLCFARRDMTLILDEAHLVCSPWSIPKEIFKAAILGRHKELNIVYIGHSLTMIHSQLLRGTDAFYFFRIVHPGDLDRVEEFCGADAADAVQELAQYQYLEWQK